MIKSSSLAAELKFVKASGHGRALLLHGKLDHRLTAAARQNFHRSERDALICVSERYVTFGSLFAVGHIVNNKASRLLRLTSDGMVNFHEILKTFHTLGCDDEGLCYGACRVYIHLTEEKHMHDVRYAYEKRLQLFYLTARKEPNASVDLFVPSLTTMPLNLVQLKRCREVIALPDGSGKPESVVVALCDPSSTVLLYRMTPGLKEIGKKLPSKGKLLRMRTGAGS